MTKFAQDLIEAMQEAAAIVKGDEAPAAVHEIPIIPDVDVRSLRATMGLSRMQFAQRFGFPPRTVQEWEQGRRRPDQATRAYLQVIEREPEAVVRALTSGRSQG